MTMNYILSKIYNTTMLKHVTGILYVENDRKYLLAKSVMID